MAETKKPSPLRALLGSRKFVAGIVYAIVAIACSVGARYGLDWKPDAAAATMLPWVLLGLSNIFGIAYEDGQSKSVGAGTTTVETTKGATTTTAVVPDVDRKP